MKKKETYITRTIQMVKATVVCLGLDNDAIQAYTFTLPMKGVDEEEILKAANENTDSFLRPVYVRESELLAMRYRMSLTDFLANAECQGEVVEASDSEEGDDQ